ncbi:MAG TPA: diguanylate cyclase [Planococcus sp. (in: firmicutes)]|nr:diguanylate cyclase [Planococcus sp. (in: firmicutes)]
MSQKNYKVLLADRTERDFSKWADQDAVSEQEIYRFLHKMIGTAGTVGLKELSDYCVTQIDYFSEDSQKLLSSVSLEHFISNVRSYFTDETTTIETTNSIEVSPINHSLVLMIDDDTNFTSHVKEILEYKGIPVVIALDAKKGMELFYTLNPQMIIVDLQLPDVDGFSLVTRIHEAAKDRYLPIAILSEDNSIEKHIHAMEIGATDFLSKPLNTKLFVSYITNRLRSQEAITRETLYDELTDARNRRNFNDVLSQMTILAERTGKPFTLVLLDLDHFKRVNDRYGHPGGDEVLTAFSHLFLNLKRDSDYFFRYGGEEFALMLPDTKAQEALTLVDRIRTSVTGTDFKISHHEPFHITFSAGISEYRLKQESLVSNADQALYQAKVNGRNQTIVYESANDKLRRKLNIIIVDDDSLVRKIVSKQLSNWKLDDVDIHIEEYADGLLFIESKWYRPDENYMILLDGVMPKMDGLEVLSYLRTQYPHEKIMISMLTSRSNESDVVLALKSGADDYIVKPFYSQEIVARVQRLSMRMLN